MILLLHMFDPLTGDRLVQTDPIYRQIDPPMGAVTRVMLSEANIREIREIFKFSREQGATMNRVRAKLTQSYYEQAKKYNTDPHAQQNNDPNNDDSDDEDSDSDNGDSDSDNEDSDDEDVPVGRHQRAAVRAEPALAARNINNAVVNDHATIMRRFWDTVRAIDWARRVRQNNARDGDAIAAVIINYWANTPENEAGFKGIMMQSVMLLSMGLQDAFNMSHERATAMAENIVLQGQDQFDRAADDIHAVEGDINNNHVKFPYNYDT